MLSSEIAGTPLANIAVRVALELAGDVSNTEPEIIIGVPAVTAVCGADTVVEVVPLPMAYICPSNWLEPKTRPLAAALGIIPPFKVYRVSPVVALMHTIIANLETGSIWYEVE